MSIFSAAKLLTKMYLFKYKTVERYIFTDYNVMTVHRHDLFDD